MNVIYLKGLRVILNMRWLESKWLVFWLLTLLVLGFLITSFLTGSGDGMPWAPGQFKNTNVSTSGIY
jgi:hypothetical protein